MFRCILKIQGSGRSGVDDNLSNKYCMGLVGNCCQWQHEAVHFSCLADNSLPQNPAIHHPLTQPTSCFISYISSIPDMSLSPSASFLVLYNSALQDYTTQTGTNLVNHPFAKRLEECESVDSISSFLQENVRRLHEFRREDGKIIKSLKCAVHVLHTLSTSTVLDEGIVLVCPKAVIYISYS